MCFLKAKISFRCKIYLCLAKKQMKEFAVEKEEIMDYFYQEREPAESIAAGIVESDTWPKLGLSSLLSIENLNTNASVSLCWAWVLERHDKVGQSTGIHFPSWTQKQRLSVWRRRNIWSWVTRKAKISTSIASLTLYLDQVLLHYTASCV